jgi:hypothetical protein
MASLFESLSSLINPDMVSALGKALGTDASAVNQGLAAAGPLLTSSLSRMASTPSGAASLQELLPKDADKALGGFGSLGSLIGSLSGGGAAGSTMLSSLLGPAVNAVGASLTRTLGFNVTPLLRIAAPAVLGLLSKRVQAEKLDSSGMAALLKRETTQFADNPANAATMKLVNEALSAGDKATAAIGSYGASWAKVEAAPVAALMAVASSDLDGPVDSVKEFKAAQAAMLEAIKAAPAGSILGAALGSGLTPEALKSVRTMASDRDALTRLIADAMAAVKQYSPADAEAFRGAIRSIGNATAEAAKEGGFLGIGGTLVSDSEKAALARIETALR